MNLDVNTIPHHCDSNDLIFLLQHYDVSIHAAGVFSKFRPRISTYRSDPYSCRFAYDAAPFGPIACQHFLLDVSCISVHSRCIYSHKADAYTLSFFKIRARTMQPHLSRFGLSNNSVQGFHSPTRGILLYFSIYIANMLKSLKTKSMEDDAQLVTMGHPNAFPSVLKASESDRTLLQSLRIPTL